MTRPLVAMLLTVPVVLSLCVREAAAQQPHSISYGSPRPMGSTYLGPTAAYPTAPVYYSGATGYQRPAIVPHGPGSGALYGSQRIASGEIRAGQPAVTPGVAQPEYGYAPCQCERCRRARGEEDGGLSGVLRGLWELEQRKNAFLGRLILGE